MYVVKDGKMISIIEGTGKGTVFTEGQNQSGIRKRSLRCLTFLMNHLGNAPSVIR